MTKKATFNIISLVELKVLSSYIVNKMIVICGAFLLTLEKFKKYENDVSALTF